MRIDRLAGRTSTILQTPKTRTSIAVVSMLTKEKNSPPKYRPDIDGLRAVAVLSVVIFHAFPSALPAGFIGVDVFFVISGYLITGILCADLSNNQFSIRDFYARRIRRIFPALATVLAATFAVGWFTLFDEEFRELGKHMLAGVGFVSNLALWQEAGYFDRAAELKPLLHLWSLGVEEQFYLIWPLLLILAFKFGVRIKLLVVVVAGISFAVELFLTRHYASAAFYLPISRFWELLAGALLTQLPRSRNSSGRASAHVLATLGFALFAYALVKITPQSRFPGTWALAPVISATLIISAGQLGWVNRWVLANPIMVSLGRVSYPWYLWHWPLLSFATIAAGQTPPPWTRVGLVACSLALAYLTYFSIEKRVRFGRSSNARTAAPVAAMIFVGIIGGVTYLRDGTFAARMSPSSVEIASASLGAGKERAEGTCLVPKSVQALFPFCYTDKREPATFAVWGDSKADALYWGLLRESAAGHRWTVLGRPSCTPMVGTNRVSSYDNDNPIDCQMANPLALKALQDDENIRLVAIVTGSRIVVGPAYKTPDVEQSDISAAINGMDGAIKALQKSGKQVALVIDNPTLPDPKQCADRPLRNWPYMAAILGVPADCSISYKDHLQKTATYQGVIQALKTRNPDLILYDPANVLCDMDTGICPLITHGKFQYSYSDHISDYSNGRIADQLISTLAKKMPALASTPRGTHGLQP